ncbi:MAG: NADP-dependent oxidoreductase [Rhodocyclaceae bacterium]|jgi:alcohol dehydrogenase|nr:NADP-dependent oxidoreductase [Rhodocyclaceae bacterium]
MKAAFIRRYGGNDVVELGELPAPQAGPGELLVAVQAASVNPVDFKIRDGMLKMIIPFGFPLILGNDFSGVVQAVGAGVTRFRPGDAVFARMDKRRIGAFAEFAVVAEADAAAKPTNLTHIEAAAVPLAGLTAWQALFEIGGLKAGQKVLIHGGSGGVGTFAIQLAHHAGATVATTVGARNAELARRLGADIVIDYKTQRFEDVVSGYDLVLDTQAGDILHRSFAVLKRGGVLVSIAGKPDGRLVREFGLNPLLGVLLDFLSRKSLRLAKRHGVRYEYLFMHPSGEQLAQLGRLLAEGSVRTGIDKVFPLEQVREALAYCEAGHATGKVVVEVKPAG